MMRTILSVLALTVFCLFFSCKEKEIIDENKAKECMFDASLDSIQNRSFGMGFSTWPFGPDENDKHETYQFIEEHADIYSEQIDDKIPWDALINNKVLPEEFLNDINKRLSLKISGQKLLLSVSLLNSERKDLLEDYDGSIPLYNSLSDKMIEDAYVKHLSYLIDVFNPDYLVFAMEVNELKLKSPVKWEQYKVLATNIRQRIKSAFPNLLLSESITLHNYFQVEISKQEEFISEISSYINQNFDFAAISFYPFFKGLHTKSEFQQAFNFLHAKVNIPIAFVETTHIAEPLILSSANIYIQGDACEQKEYLETLLLNAHQNKYKFIIWWAYRDFDKLWATFEEKYKESGLLWRDTGLLDENGNPRFSFSVWKNIYNR